MAAELTPLEDHLYGEFGYMDFGAAGQIVSDNVEPLLGIREIQFANGVKLNLKRTELERDRIRLELNVDGGEMLDTSDDPLATAMVSVLHVGGLGLHDYDELQTMLAGKSVGFRFTAEDETFRMQSITTPRDLELQMKLIAAALTDPGYRPQGQAQYQRFISNFFASRNATPAGTLSDALGGILSDGDPRFTTQPEEIYRALTLEDLRAAIADRLEHGAVEIALVGDIDEERAIELVGATLGALPARERDFGLYAENRDRPFTNTRGRHIVRHQGEPDQALVHLVWPTRDGEDLVASLELELLERVARLALTDKLREELGQTYSPRVSASQSRTWPGYGTFSISAQVDTGQVDAARSAMLETVAALSAAPVDEDMLLRARQPVLESYANALSTNAGWMNLTDRAQTQSDRIMRFIDAPEAVASITAERLREMAAQYLVPDGAVEVIVLPEDAELQ
jgi:zinc protease